MYTDKSPVLQKRKTERAAADQPKKLFPEVDGQYLVIGMRGHTPTKVVKEIHRVIYIDRVILARTH